MAFHAWSQVLVSLLSLSDTLFDNVEVHLLELLLVHHHGSARLWLIEHLLVLVLELLLLHVSGLEDLLELHLHILRQLTLKYDLTVLVLGEVRLAQLLRALGFSHCVLLEQVDDLLGRQVVHEAADLGSSSGWQQDSAQLLRGSSRHLLLLLDVHHEVLHSLLLKLEVALVCGIHQPC